MATTKIYFDRRVLRADGTYPLKFTITRNGRSSHINLGVYLRPEQWDGRRCRVINHEQCEALNVFIRRRHAELDWVLYGKI